LSEPDEMFDTKPPKPGAVQRVGDGVFWLRMPLPMALDHINLYLLEDGDGWTVIDTGLGDPTTEGLWEEVISKRSSKIAIATDPPPML